MHEFTEVPCLLHWFLSIIFTNHSLAWFLGVFAEHCAAFCLSYGDDPSQTLHATNGDALETCTLLVIPHSCSLVALLLLRLMEEMAFRKFS